MALNIKKIRVITIKMGMVAKNLKESKTLHAVNVTIAIIKNFPFNLTSLSVDLSDLFAKIMKVTNPEARKNINVYRVNG